MTASAPAASPPQPPCGCFCTPCNAGNHKFCANTTRCTRSTAACGCRCGACQNEDHKNCSHVSSCPMKNAAAYAASAAQPPTTPDLPANPPTMAPPAGPGDAAVALTQPAPAPAMTAPPPASPSLASVGVVGNTLYVIGDDGNPVVANQAQIESPTHPLFRMRSDGQLARVERAARTEDPEPAKKAPSGAEEAGRPGPAGDRAGRRPAPAPAPGMAAGDPPALVATLATQLGSLEARLSLYEDELALLPVSEGRSKVLLELSEALTEVRKLSVGLYALNVKVERVRASAVALDKAGP